MKLKVNFREAEECFFAKFAELERSFLADFDKVLVVNRTDIPPEYGLITYDQNRTITVS